MYPDNPYQPPSTSLEATNPRRDDVWDFTDPRRLPAGRGWFWIAEGFRLFASSPGIWIVNTIIFFIITMIVALIPLVSIANYILQPIFLGGLMRGTHELDTNGNYEVNHLFCGFQENGSKLAVVGVLQLGIIMLVAIAAVIIIAIFIGTAAFMNQDGSWDPDTAFTAVGVIIAVLFSLIFVLMFGMAFWLAPQLVMLHNLEAVQSVKMSFIGSWRNLVPLIVFGLIMMVFMVIAMIPFFLGLLVMWPVFIAATYAAWKDIFTNAY